MATAVLKHISDNELNELSTKCIQLSTENVCDAFLSLADSCKQKITQKNSWILQLIDYIDQIVARQCSGETTNFQVASVTLDASVKIYSNRVDSVHGTAYQVLGGLTRTNYQDDHDQPDDAKDGEGEAPAKQRTRHETVNTIETNPKNLNVRKFDLEFDVDPLFRKVSATMDEGGARGLLLNQLPVQAGCRLIFDSADVASASVNNDTVEQTTEEVQPIVIPNLDDLPTVESNTAQQSPLSDGSATDEQQTAETETEASTPSFPLEDAMNEIDAMLDAGLDHEQAITDMGGEGFSDGEDDSPLNEAPPTLPAKISTPRRSSVAGTALESLQLALDTENEFGWFAPEKLQSWAGPTHWKFKRVVAAKGMMNH